MKIRYGFVSNSSSASFLLEIRSAAEKIDTLLLKEFPQYFERNNFNKILQASIELLEKLKIYEKMEQTNIYFLRMRDNNKRIKKLKRLQRKVIKLSDTQLVWEVLRFYDYNILSVDKKSVTLSGWTSMWNDDTDMGEVMLAIRNLLDTKYSDSISYKFILSCN